MNGTPKISDIKPERDSAIKESRNKGNNQTNVINVHGDIVVLVVIRSWKVPVYQNGYLSWLGIKKVLKRQELLSLKVLFMVCVPGTEYSYLFGK